MGEEAGPKRREHRPQPRAIQHGSRWACTAESTSNAAARGRRHPECQHTLGFDDSAPKAERKGSYYQLLILITSDMVTVWLYWVK